MTTQTNNNKQSQNVKVIVNNNITAPPRRKQRRKPPPPPENTGDMPMPVPTMPPFAVGMSPYANRPLTFAPSVQMIQADNGMRVPPYFEKPYTNREASLTEMRNALRSELEDVREALFAQARNPQEAQQAHSAVNSLERSALSSMEISAPSMPSVVGGNAGNSSSSSSSLPDPPHIPQVGSGIAGVPPAPPSSTTTNSSSVGSVGGGSSGNGGGGNGSESTVQGGRPPSVSSQGLSPRSSLPDSPQAPAGYSFVGGIAPPPVPLPELSSGSLGSHSVQGGYGGQGSASLGGGYGGQGSVNMSGSSMGSVALPNVGNVVGASSGSVGSRVGDGGGLGGAGSHSEGGYGGQGSVNMSDGSMGSVAPPNLDAIYGNSSGSVGSGVAQPHPRLPAEHPHAIASALYSQYREATGNKKNNLGQQIRNIGQQFGIEARNMIDILRGLVNVRVE